MLKDTSYSLHSYYSTVPSAIPHTPCVCLCATVTVVFVSPLSLIQSDSWNTAVYTKTHRECVPTDTLTTHISAITRSLKCANKTQTCTRAVTCRPDILIHAHYSQKDSQSPRKHKLPVTHTHTM